MKSVVIASILAVLLAVLLTAGAILLLLLLRLPSGVWPDPQKLYQY